MYKIKFDQEALNDNECCKFWNNTHELSNLNSELWDALVPGSGGKSSSFHGELLRMVNRLYYDIFNNGLCNDKSEEIEFLVSNLQKYRHLIKNPSEVADLLLALKHQHTLEEEAEQPKTYGFFSDEDEDYEDNYDSYIPPIVLTKDRCIALDDLVQAVALYCQSQVVNV